MENIEDKLETQLDHALKYLIDDEQDYFLLEAGIYSNKQIFEAHKKFKYLLEKIQKKILHDLVHNVGDFHKLSKNLISCEDSYKVQWAKEFQKYFLKELRELDRI
jgi:hypothetical protein